MRLRLENSKQGRFWEARIADTALTVRAGSIGTEGRVTIDKQFPDQAAALAHAQGIVDTLCARGYVQVAGGDEPRSPELEAAILREPDDEEARRVYGDWLQTQGHPRGELCALDYALASDPNDGKLVAARRRLLADTAVLPEALQRASSRRATLPGKSCVLTWRGGFVHEATLGHAHASETSSLHELVVALLGHPCSRLLHALTIGARLSRVGRYDDVVDEITQWRPRSLRSLALACFPESVTPIDAIVLGSLEAMTAALPGLTRLHVRGISLSFGHLELPELTELVVQSPLLGHAFESMSSLELPRLQHLHLHENHPPEAVLALPWARLPDALQRLSLTHTTGTHDHLVQLMSSRSALGLTHLSLAHGDLTDEEAIIAAGWMPRFPKLVHLDVRDNALSPRGLDALRAVVEIDGSDQRLPVDYGPADLRRYATGGAAIESAAAIASLEHWYGVHQHLGVLWGRYRGGKEEYLVRFNAAPIHSACTCKSRVRPCKHVLALALLGWRVPATDREMPLELYERQDDDGDYYDEIHE